MADEAAQERGAGGDGEERPLGVPIQRGGVFGSEVSERVSFGMRPDELDGIELRGITGEQMNMDTLAMAGEPGGGRASAVGREPVPDEIEWAVQMAAERFEEMADRFAVVIGIGQEAEVAAHAVSMWRNRERGNDRHLAPRTPALDEDRGLAARRPTAPHERGHQEPRFIAEEESRPAAGSVFFTRGHSCLSQRRIAASSRSSARRAGFCALHPRLCSNRPIWFT